MSNGYNSRALRKYVCELTLRFIKSRSAGATVSLTSHFEVTLKKLIALFKLVGRWYSIRATRLIYSQHFAHLSGRANRLSDHRVVMLPRTGRTSPAEGRGRAKCSAKRKLSG